MEQQRRVVAGGTERNDGDDMRSDVAETSRRGSETTQVDVRAGTVQRMRRIYKSQQGTERQDASQQSVNITASVVVGAARVVLYTVFCTLCIPAVLYIVVTVAP